MRSVDAFLLACPKRAQLALIVATLVVMIWQALPNVPREFVDFARVPALAGIAQPATFGTDTIADTYASKVILNDPWDMYTRQRLDQTPEEAATWTKAESAPYLPVVLLTEAALTAIGQRAGVGLYGMILLMAALFIGGSAWYFFQTRWYLFPLLYLNFSYFGWRFVAVQDCTYLVMLVVILAALFLARAGRTACHALIAIAITMKLSPLYYVKNLPRMSPRMAVLFVVILIAGLIAPYFIWDNYLYIFTFHDQLKGSRSGMVSGLAFGAIFSVLLWYVETRRGFDLEERLGWSLIPFALFLAWKMNVPRHLLIVLLVPDKRAARNVIAAFALLVPVLLPGVVRFGATLPIASVLLFVVLGWHLRAIGWPTVVADWRQPARTLRLMLGREGV